MGVISPVGTDSNGNALTAAAQKTLDKDDFLRLLVTKLTHQDPMKPMEDEAFVAELAQFSSLEQLQNLNKSMENSQQWDYLQMQTINNTMATSLIGKNVKAAYNGVYLGQDDQASVKYSTTEFAGTVTVRILDADGNLVRTLTQENVAPGQNSVKWDGKDEEGKNLSSGYYTVDISATNAQGVSFTPSMYTEGTVTGVTYRDGSAYLQVNGMEIPLSSVIAVEQL